MTIFIWLLDYWSLYEQIISPFAVITSEMKLTFCSWIIAQAISFGNGSVQMECYFFSNGDDVISTSSDKERTDRDILSLHFALITDCKRQHVSFLSTRTFQWY